MQSVVQKQMVQAPAPELEGSEPSTTKMKVAEDHDSFQERIKIWAENCDNGDVMFDLTEEFSSFHLPDDNGIDDDEPEMPGLAQYRTLVYEAPAYELLLRDLRNTFALEHMTPERNFMDEINQKVLRLLPLSNRMSRYRPQKVFSVSFAVAWDPVAFLEEQQYDASLDEALATAVTLTGTSVNAQALSCSQYLSQTWPLRGEVLLSTVNEALCSGAPSSGESSNLRSPNLSA